MNRSLLSLLVLAALLAVMGCAQDNPDTTRIFDLEKVKSDIADIDAQFIDAFSKGDSAGIAALYHPDAVAFPPNSEPVTGAGKIAELAAAVMRTGVKGIRLQSSEVMGDPEWIIETGFYEMIGDSARVLDKGKYIIIWKEAQGSLKIYRDMWSSNNPLPLPQPEM